MTFAADISKFIQRTDAKVAKVVREVVIEIGTGVVLMSPVGQPALWKSPAPKGYVGGHFRANWQYGFGSYPENEVADIDASGRVSIDRVKAGVQAAPVAGVHYIVNNLPYAEALENGHSTQAPEGMVGKTVLRFEGVVKRAAS